MTWNKVAGLLVGVLLTLPLAGLLLTSSGGILLGTGKRGESLRLVPHLRGAAAMRVETFQQPCREDKECKLPLSCFVDARDGRRECRDSSCMTDDDCSAGFTCQPLRSASDTALFRICVPLGVRKEGEQCNVMPESTDEGCEQGLRCDVYCGRSCQVEDPHSCPEGFFCKDKMKGALCWPTCKGLSCPEGQECVETWDGASTCARVVGSNCQRTPCAGEARCSIETRPSSPHVVWMDCLPSCTPGGQECPEGRACFVRECRRACDPQAPDSCGPDHECSQLFPQLPWVCVLSSQGREG